MRAASCCMSETIFTPGVAVVTPRGSGTVIDVRPTPSGKFIVGVEDSVGGERATHRRTDDSLMNARALGTVGVLVFALLLTGCAAQPGSTQTPDSADPSTPPTSTPQTPDAQASTEGAYLDYTDGAIEATAGPKVLFFHASWCPQCRTLDEQLLAEGAPDGLTVFKVDYDSRTDLRQRYGVTLQTTVVFVDDRGEPISSAVLYDDPSIESLLAAMP